MHGANRVELSARLIERRVLRRTPAGVAVIEFRLRHESRRDEAGSERAVSAELDAIAFDTQANLLGAVPLDRPLQVQGFLCAKSRRSKKLVLHVTNIEFIEGD